MWQIMLSIGECKKILSTFGDKLNDEEVKSLRTILYQLGEMDYKLIKTQLNEQGSSSLHQGVNR
jgi:fructose-1,6-bisphosphatase